LQSWESQAAVSRLQVSGAIVEQAAIVGDDGLRSAIVPDLKPLPRTSEDCDNAALAYLQDRSRTSYNGSYACTSMFLDGITADIQYWPTVGRFLNVNAPKRDLENQKYLVSTLSWSINEARSEQIQFQIGFGADLFLEKMLKNFVDLAPVSVLAPTDKANPPNPRYTQDVTSSFLPDLNNVQVDLMHITATECPVQVVDDWAGLIEIRRQDTNWGRSQTQAVQTPDFVAVVRGPSFTLPRRQYDQQWYLRPVTPPDSAFGVITSRRSKVLRVMWPMQPFPPLFIGQNGMVLQFNFNGDNRNIYGFEMRYTATNGATVVLVQKPCPSYADLTVDLTQTALSANDDYGNATWDIDVFFFSVAWYYSEQLKITVVNTLALGQTVQVAYIPSV
jgi:hypothetical protein